MVHDHESPRTGADPRAAAWDVRYRDAGQAMWSGRPNGRLVAEVSGLAPGRALDVGCGEGADAIWLAGQGWTVTAIDVSPVAIGRARQAARIAGATVEWINGDVLTNPFPAKSFDLVSLQYPALPKIGRQAVLAVLECVRPDGVLLAVYHDLDDHHREHMKSSGFDPADFFDADDLREMVSDDFTIEQHSVQERIDPPPDTPHVADVVLKVRRRRSAGV